MEKVKGLSTAIAIVITIVVLLIIALAVIGVSTGAIGNLSKTVNKAPSGDELTKTVCASQTTEQLCNLYDECTWTGEECVPA